MRIGVIGAGDIAQTIGQAWSRAGHKVMLSSRHPADLETIVGVLDVDVGTPSEAAEYGDLILLAVNYWTIDEAIEAIKPHVDGKLVIDATNPLVHAEEGGVKRVIADHELAGQLMQARLPRARIGKAFTTLWTGYLTEHAFAQPRIAIPLAADRTQDRVTIAGLIEQAGFEPVELGALSDSRPLDPPSAIWNVVLTAAELAERVTVLGVAAE